MADGAPGEQRYAGAQEAALALASSVAATLETALRGGGEARLALSGGRTPMRFLQALGAQPMAWSRVSVTLVDERWAPATDPRSNAGLAHRALLQGPAASARFLPLYRADAAPDAAAAAPTPALAAFLEAGPDVAVLGLGADHHVASLFPGDPASAAALAIDGAALLAATRAPDGEARLSMTLAALARAGRLDLQIQGAAKIAVFDALKQRAGGVDPAAAPAAALLRPPLLARLTVWIAPD